MKIEKSNQIKKYFLTIANIMILVPTGVFTPTLVIGAAIGRLIGEIVQLYFPESAETAGIAALVGWFLLFFVFSKFLISIKRSRSIYSCSDTYILTGSYFI